MGMGMGMGMGRNYFSMGVSFIHNYLHFFQAYIDAYLLL
jgi:hypothetical protein